MSRVMKREMTLQAALLAVLAEAGHSPQTEAELRRGPGLRTGTPVGRGEAPATVTRCLRRCANPAHACMLLYKAIVSSPESRF